MNITPRDATRDDAEALFALIAAHADHHDQRQYLLADANTLRRDGFGDHPRFGALVIEIDGELIGYLTYTFNYSIWLAATYLNIDDVFVLPTHRGQGLGETLMRRAREICAARGCPRLRWEVRAENAAAIAFYERLGASFSAKGVFAWPAR